VAVKKGAHSGFECWVTPLPVDLSCLFHEHFQRDTRFEFSRGVPLVIAGNADPAHLELGELIASYPVVRFE
jgi:hypothetical protein